MAIGCKMPPANVFRRTLGILVNNAGYARGAGRLPAVNQSLNYLTDQPLSRHTPLICSKNNCR
jgi:hypothetical protein